MGRVKVFEILVSGRLSNESILMEVISRVTRKLSRPVLSAMKIESPIKFLIDRLLFTSGIATSTSQLAVVGLRQPVKRTTRNNKHEKKCGKRMCYKYNLFNRSTTKQARFLKAD